MTKIKQYLISIFSLMLALHGALIFAAVSSSLSSSSRAVGVGVEDVRTIVDRGGLRFSLVKAVPKEKQEQKKRHQDTLAEVETTPPVTGHKKQRLVEQEGKTEETKQAKERKKPKAKLRAALPPTLEDLAKFPAPLVQPRIPYDFRTLAGLTNLIFTACPSSLSSLDDDFARLFHEDYLSAAIPLHYLMEAEQEFFDLYKRELSDKAAWLTQADVPGDAFLSLDNDDEKLEFAHPYVQRKFIPKGSQVCFFGDLHGDVHALLRNLWRLVEKGYLANDFSIKKPNFYMIFTGDFVDRGLHGAEVWYILMKLKLAPGNQDRVILLRGNHESAAQSSIRLSGAASFQSELFFKYERTIARLPQWNGLYKSGGFNLVHKQLTKLNRLLPHALFLGSGAIDDEKASFVQCCHGGIEIGFDAAPLIESKKVFQKITGQVPESCMATCAHVHGLYKTGDGKTGYRDKSDNYTGFNWSDFIQCHDDGDAGKILLNTRGRGSGYLVDVKAIRDYLVRNPLIKGFFRGHQDMYYGFKMFFTDVPKSFSEKITTDENTELEGYQDGPFYFADVLKYADAKEEKTEGKAEGDEKEVTPVACQVEKITIFPLVGHIPVFTFTNAVSARGVAHDMICIVSTAETFSAWLMQAHEYPLSARAAYHPAPDRREIEERFGKYIALKIVTDPHTGSRAVQTLFNTEPSKEPVDPALVRLAKAT